MRTSKTSYKDYLNLSLEEFEKLDTKELKKAVSRLRDVANLRLNRLAKKGLTTPASNYQKFTANVNLLYSRKANQPKQLNPVNELREEFTRARNFLNLKSSTIKGALQIEKNFTNKFTELGGTNFDRNTFWRLYNKVKEIPSNKGIVERLGSNQLQHAIAKYLVANQDKGLSIDELAVNFDENSITEEENTEEFYEYHSDEE